MQILTCELGLTIRIYVCINEFKQNLDYICVNVRGKMEELGKKEERVASLKEVFCDLSVVES